MDVGFGKADNGIIYIHGMGDKELNEWAERMSVEVRHMNGFDSISFRIREIEIKLFT